MSLQPHLAIFMLLGVLRNTSVVGTKHFSYLVCVVLVYRTRFEHHRYPLDETQIETILQQDVMHDSVCLCECCQFVIILNGGLVNDAMVCKWVCKKLRRVRMVLCVWMY